MDRRPFRTASLAERTAGRSPAGSPAAAPGGAGQAPGAPRPDPSPTGGPARHCWVVADQGDGAPEQQRAPGLLVEWRQLGGSWQGRVAYVLGVDGEATLVEAWLPASQLERAGGS